MSSRDRAILATHHVVLECQPITLFLNVLECQPITTLFLILRPSKKFLAAALLLTAEASLGSACGADCGAAAAFGKEEISIFYSFFHFSLLIIFFSFASCDVG